MKWAEGEAGISAVCLHHVSTRTRFLIESVTLWGFCFLSPEMEPMLLNSKGCLSVGGNVGRNPLTWREEV